MALAVLAALLALIAAAGLSVYLRWMGIGFLGPARTARAAAMPDLPGLAAAAGWLASLVGLTAGVAAGWVLPWAGGATAWLVRGQPVIAPTYLRPEAYAPIVALGAALFRGVAGSSGNVIFAAGGFNVASPWDLALCGLLLGLAVAWVTGRWGRRREVRAVRVWVGGEPDDAVRLVWTAEALYHPLRLTFAAFFGLKRSRRSSGEPLAHGRLRYRARVVLRLEHHVFRPLMTVMQRASGAVRQAVQSGDLSRYVGYLLGFAILGVAAAALLK